jgi:hypothetical protein
VGGVGGNADSNPDSVLRSKRESDENAPVSSSNEDSSVAMHIPNVEWGPYIPNISKSEDDYADDQEMLQIKYNKHNRGGHPLWFENSANTAWEIWSQITDPDIQFITAVGEPDVGKTSVMHCLIFVLSMMPYEKAIHPNCITMTTGMSDTDWYDQLLKAFRATRI